MQVHGSGQPYIYPFAHINHLAFSPHAFAVLFVQWKGSQTPVVTELGAAGDVLQFGSKKWGSRSSRSGLSHPGVRSQAQLLAMFLGVKP
jgi:hypothetical protein